MSLVLRALIAEHRISLNNSPTGEFHLKDQYNVTHCVDKTTCVTSCGLTVYAEPSFIVLRNSAANYRFATNTWDDVDCMQCLLVENQ